MRHLKIKSLFYKNIESIENGTLNNTLMDWLMDKIKWKGYPFAWMAQ